MDEMIVRTVRGCGDATRAQVQRQWDAAVGVALVVVSLAGPAREPPPIFIGDDTTDRARASDRSSVPGNGQKGTEATEMKANGNGF